MTALDTLFLNLNSIMILLIQGLHVPEKGKTFAFKFHYDSINSPVPWLSRYM